MIGKYNVITLCGSTRFKDAFLEAQKQMTLEGNIVISVGLFGHSGDEEVWTPGTKEMLDDMHKRKIDMADEIYVINVDGYIGDSTRSEIEYALSSGKKVQYLIEPQTERKDKLPVVFFWKDDEENGCFSNWFSKSFVIDDFEYLFVEQYMMAQKAKLFHDSKRYTAILRATKPWECKEFGKQVTPFVPAAWDAILEMLFLRKRAQRISFGALAWMHLRLLKSIHLNGRARICLGKS